jgi:hypothetical protein
MNINEYPYLYETHLHTRRGSACAVNTGAEMAEAARKAGYAGIIVTEHNWGGNTAIPRSLPWEQWVDEFSKGYQEAYEYGQVHDLDVFFGYEAGYQGTEFLIYGVDPQWLKSHPEIREASIEEQYHLIHGAGGLVVHAHPFREEWYIPEIRLFPEYVDAVEGINATHSCKKSMHHNDPAFDDRAIAYAAQHHLPITAGSDIHTTDMFGGGIALKRRMTSIHDYREVLLGQEDYVLTNGDAVFDKFGKRL